MNNKTLSLAGITLLSGMVTSAHAVYLNPNGHGEVLLYPFYSVEGGNDTYISVVNTTEDVKALKVHILEAMNGLAVYDFNLYLSAGDHWSAVVTDDPDSEGAKLITADTSCTVPEIPQAGVAFSDTYYAGDSVNGLQRTREGYVQIIEQGTVTDADLAAAATHVDGTPTDCNQIRAAWENSGQWKSQPKEGMSGNTGGLYGYGVIINVADGIDVSYRATALDEFTLDIVHSAPGSHNPDLRDADPTSTVYVEGESMTFDWTGTQPSPGLNAVSSTLMTSSLRNDYVLEPSINAGTDWVLTLPTKWDYINREGGPYDPFSNNWDPLISAGIEEIDMKVYDREERSYTVDSDYVFPLPPGLTGFIPYLNYQSNVITMNQSDVLHASDRITLNSDLDYDNGWITLSFQNADPIGSPSGRTLVSTNGSIFHGFPVIGFAVQKYVNGDIGGLLSNYAGLVEHVMTQNIDLP